MTAGSSHQLVAEPIQRFRAAWQVGRFMAACVIGGTHRQCALRVRVVVFARGGQGDLQGRYVPLW